MSTKKSEVHSQIFVYILTVVVTSLLLVYGFNSIQKFRKSTEELECLKLKKDLSGAIKSILGDFGSVKKKDVRLCKNYKEICFVETLEFNSINLDNINWIRYPFEISSPNPPDPIISGEIKSGTGKNAFLVDKIAKESFNIGTISVNKDVLCIKAQNNLISLKLEGKGDHVLIDKW